MKLKRLEIIGFKSFMDRTVVTFDRDITSIVGPNGCGKSNIVDAIRWVMGEQSAKHLRGKQMEDVIFAGSEKRPPLSMGRVELTFGTEGFQTPADYLNSPEISVGRVLYRTGESEYFINRVAVRLKDVTDLFLGTGIGTKAYSIIEQGRVGQVITSRPEERRFYIEEVAGTSKFKTRKEAALRKIEATQQNLLRLNDLTAELERQLKSLDRQAKKAEKYRELRREFDHVDLTLLSTQYADDHTEQTRLEKNLRTFDENEAVLKARLLESENLQEVVRLSRFEKEKELQTLQSQLFEITNYIRLFESSLHYKDEEKKNLEKNTAEGQIYLEELETKRFASEDCLSQINDQKLEVDLEEEVLGDEVGCHELLVLELQHRLNEAQSATDAIRERVHGYENQQIELAAKKANVIHQKELLDPSLQKNRQELEEVREKQGELKKVWQETTVSLSQLKQLKLDLTLRTDTLSEDVKKHRADLRQHETDLLRLKEDLALRKSRLVSLEELQRNFEGYQEGTRSVLLKKNELGSDGIYGTVADFVETEPRYEGAVSAVLGEKLQYVVVKTHQQSLEAVDYLKTAAIGRSSFVPMEVRVHAHDGDEIKPQEGVLGPLTRFVTLKADYAHLQQFLFGDVVLVDDLRKALEIWDANGHQKTLVTLDGEVVDPSGVITGGSLANTSKALLEKKREIRELGILISELEYGLNEKEKLAVNLKEHVQGLEASLDRVKHSSVEEEIKIANQEKDVSQLKKELETGVARGTLLESQIAEGESQLNGLLGQASWFETSEVEVKSQAEIERVLFAQEKEGFENLKKEMEQEAQEWMQKKIKLAKSHERSANLSAEINRLISQKIELEFQKNKQKGQLELNKEKMDFLKKQKNHLTRVLDKRLEKKIALEQKNLEEREAYQSKAKDIQEQEIQLKALRRDREMANERLHEVSVALTEIRARMKHWVQQGLERHQLSLVEVYRERADSQLNRKEATAKVAELKEKLSKIGDVNTAALTEYEELKTRFDFLSKQKEDLETSLRSLERVIQKINATTKERFMDAFKCVNEKFQVVFPKLFHGGQARLVLTNDHDLLETGIDIVAQPPGKKLQSISLLSGGEKALTAVSLIFSIFQIKPSPFCILDEVDAPLDDANVTRYNEMLREMTHRTQFVVITHNKKTMEMADVLYGITMQEPGISQLVSVELN